MPKLMQQRRAQGVGKTIKPLRSQLFLKAQRFNNKDACFVMMKSRKSAKSMVYLGKRFINCVVNSLQCVCYLRPGALMKLICPRAQQIMHRMILWVTKQLKLCNQKESKLDTLSSIAHSWLVVCHTLMKEFLLLMVSILKINMLLSTGKHSLSCTAYLKPDTLRSHTQSSSGSNSSIENWQVPCPRKNT